MIPYLKFQLTFIAVSCLIFLLFALKIKQFYSNFDDPVSCYFEKSRARLPDISEANVVRGKSIFFHDTSCSSFQNGKLTLSPRRACAVESAARLNPNTNVYLTFLSPGLLTAKDNENDHILQGLVSYTNIKLHHLDLEKYLKRTPLEDLYVKDKIVGTPNARTHVRNVLKYLTLYKFGGIYLDLDLIVIKSLENLKPNFAGITGNNQTIGSGILGFGDDQSGRNYTVKCLEALRSNYLQSSISANTSNIITKVLMKSCGAQNVTGTTQHCKDFKLYASEAFYPVPNNSWSMYFDPDQMLDVFNMAKDAYTLYLWGEHNEQELIPVYMQTAYMQYFKKYCPKVFDVCNSVI